MWFDNLAVPKGAPHADAAMAFLNFVLEPKESVLITKEFPYSNPNAAALEYLKTSDPDIYKSLYGVSGDQSLCGLSRARCRGEGCWQFHGPI